MRLSDERFRELVEQALKSLPEQFSERLDNVEILIEDEPDPQTREHFPGLLGLYRGVPQTERSTFHLGLMPDVISIYKRNIERLCRSEAEVRREVRKTLLHEIGHHFGLSEEDLEDFDRS
jgi:predicted Zn-dependent protease with MMP-like domain